MADSRVIACVVGVVFAVVGYLATPFFTKVWFPNMASSGIASLVKRQRVVYVLAATVCTFGAVWFQVRS